jgi:ribosome maturation factor RimP
LPQKHRRKEKEGTKSPLFVNKVEQLEKATVEHVIENKFGESDKYLVDLTLNQVNKKIQVIIDGDLGVSIDDCVDLSRHIRAHFEEEMEDFNLEVSSPGIGQPLVLQRQYLKNVGKLLEVNTIENEVMTGEMLSTDNEGIKLRLGSAKKKIETGDEVELRYSNIKSAKVILSLK